MLQHRFEGIRDLGSNTSYCNTFSSGLPNNRKSVVHAETSFWSFKSAKVFGYFMCDCMNHKDRMPKFLCFLWFMMASLHNLLFLLLEIFVLLFWISVFIHFFHADEIKTYLLKSLMLFLSQPSLPKGRPQNMAMRCPKLAYRCPKLAFRCPKLASRCPKLASRCPKLASRCLKLASRCPKLASRCPKLASRWS